MASAKELGEALDGFDCESGPQSTRVSERSRPILLALTVALGAAVGMLGCFALMPVVEQHSTDSIISYDLDCIKKNRQDLDTIADSCQVTNHGHDLAKTFAEVLMSKFASKPTSGMNSLTRPAVSSRNSDPQMFNLFGNSEESKRQRDELSLRDPPKGSRVVTLNKINSVASAASLGLKLGQSWNGAVVIKDTAPGSPADRAKQAGRLKIGDEITMVSATFGDEMWSCRNVGVNRLENSIRARQGMRISFCLEEVNSERASKAQSAEEAKNKEKARMARLQRQLESEVNREKGKGGGFNPFR